MSWQACLDRWSPTGQLAVLFWQACLDRWSPTGQLAVLFWQACLDRWSPTGQLAVVVCMNAESQHLAVSAKQLEMRFDGSPASLADLDLDVGAGEFVSIVGPSGCGKSTLLRLIAGLIAPTSGALTINSSGDSAPRVGFVFQDANLLPWRSVTDNIRLPFEIDQRLQTIDQQNSTKAPSIKDAITASLKLIGLRPEDACKLPAQLSGGMRMRVSLARALVTEPEILLLDEPFAALDDILRQQLNEDLQRIWWQQNWTGLFVTHNVGEAVFQSQRVLIMSSTPGRIVDEVQVPFEYPREHTLRVSSEFAELVGQVSLKLRTASLPSRQSSDFGPHPQAEEGLT